MVTNNADRSNAGRARLPAWDVRRRVMMVALLAAYINSTGLVRSEHN